MWRGILHRGGHPLHHLHKARRKLGRGYCPGDPYWFLLYPFTKSVGFVSFFSPMQQSHIHTVFKHYHERAAEKKYYIRQCSRLSSKRTLKDHHRWWGTAKSLCGIRTSRSLPTLVNNGSPVSSPLDKAECLNNFFAAQCTTMSAVGDSTSPVVNAPTINATFSFEPVTSLDVLKKLKSLNPWKSPGPDLITNKVLKECAGEISLPLVHIFNCSLKTGIFPSSWKSGAVTPVFKCKGSSSDPKSYRPITLLPCLSKIFESFVRDKL